MQLVLGVSFPVETRDKVNFRTLNLAYNFQGGYRLLQVKLIFRFVKNISHEFKGQYMLVKPATYPWAKVKRSLHNQNEAFLDNKTMGPDNTRQLVYNVVEILIDR